MARRPKSFLYGRSGDWDTGRCGWMLSHETSCRDANSELEANRASIEKWACEALKSV